MHPVSLILTSDLCTDPPQTATKTCLSLGHEHPGDSFWSFALDQDTADPAAVSRKGQAFSMSKRLALLTLLGHRILSCTSLRHDEEAPKPPSPAPALLQRGLDAGNESAPQILCGSVKQIGAKYKLHCDQHLQKIREVFKVPTPDQILSSNNIDLDQAEQGTGKSGAKMLFSSDKQSLS
eukprot:s180_g41.t1